LVVDQIGCPPTGRWVLPSSGARVWHWIEYLDGTSSAAAASHAAHGSVNLGLAATLPAARRRGVWHARATARRASIQT
jgi:hypothetical protein